MQQEIRKRALSKHIVLVSIPCTASRYVQSGCVRLTFLMNESNYFVYNKNVICKLTIADLQVSSQKDHHLQQID